MSLLLGSCDVIRALINHLYFVTSQKGTNHVLCKDGSLRKVSK